MANLKPVRRRESRSVADSLRSSNLYLTACGGGGMSQIRVQNPDGAHSIACGLDADLDVQIQGMWAITCGNEQLASVTVHGNADRRGENMMSGRGACQRSHRPPPALRRTAACCHRWRCFIALRHFIEGSDIVVGGASAAFRVMAQAGRLVICRRCRRCAGRFAVRSRDLRSRPGPFTRRRRALSSR